MNPLLYSTAARLADAVARPDDCRDSGLPWWAGLLALTNVAGAAWLVAACW